ncbi:hypothetical protein Tco_0603212 [Tanacetum coccineum]
MAVRVPHAMSSGLSADMAEVAAMSESTFRKRFWSSYESSPSVSPPDLPSRKRYRGTSELVEDSEEDDDEEDEEIKESLDLDSVSEDAKDEGPTAEDEDPTKKKRGEGDGGSYCGAPVVGTIVSAPLGLGYGALRHRELVLEEGDVYSTFEVGQGSRSAPKSERPERVSAFRQPILITWTDPEDGMIYVDIPDYPPPALPVQTPPSPKWTSGSLPISPSPSDDPSPISSPMIPLTIPSPVATPAAVETKGFMTKLGAQVQIQGGLISDHAVRLEELSPALFERYDRDIGELFTSDVQGENQDLRLQLAEERRARLELVEVVDGMRRGQKPRGVFERFWNGLPRMGRAEMVDQARFAWGLLSVFSNANSDRVAITSRTGSYLDTRLRQ